MSFTEIADRRLLTSVKDHLEELTWDVEADGYQRLRVPPTADVEHLLRLLLRRGLDPSLTTLLLDRFETRPIERALIAWDIAAGTLFGHDDSALAARVRSNLSPLKQIGATTSVAVPREQVDALIAAVSALGERPMPEGVAPQPSLASVATLAASELDAAFAFADQLALAHLPSLALAFYQIAWQRREVDRALDQIVEIALDFDRLDSIPVTPDSGNRATERKTYFAVRLGLARLDTDAAASMLDQMSTHPEIASSSDAALAVAKAELDLLSDKPTPYGSDEPIAAVATPTWRYASRVRDELRIQLHPENAATWVDSFLTSFGNDLHVWAQAGLHPEARAALLALVSREVRYGSFDPEAWRALAIFVDDGSPIELELQQRSAAQLAAALA